MDNTNQDNSQAGTVSQQDENQQNQETQNVTVRPGGLEAGGQSMEASGEKPFEQGKEAGETLSVPEKGQEVQKSVKKKPVQDSPPIQPKKKANSKKKLPELSVFGFMVPAKISQNRQEVVKKAGKGNPKSGLTNLYVFLERLMKMSQTA